MVKNSRLENFKNKTLNENEFSVLIEIEKGSKNKYEYDLETGFLRLDRILYTSTHYPHNYGFIPLTLADDGDPLDVLVISSESILPLSIVKCKPIGVLEMIDGNKLDYKIMAVCLNDPFYKDFDDISDLPEHMSEEIRHFFKVYKTLEHNKNTDVGFLRGKERAQEIIKDCIEAYKRESK